MNLKTIVSKVASWFKGEAKTAESNFVMTADGLKVRVEGEWHSISDYIEKEVKMSTPIAAAAVTSTVDKVATAVQIALALKAIDSTLAVEAIQAGTAAALAVLYPAA